MSYYAKMVWEAAVLRPPHLAEILAWQAISDVRRRAYFHAGIPMNFFNNRWIKAMCYFLDPVLPRPDYPVLARTGQQWLQGDNWFNFDTKIWRIDIIFKPNRRLYLVMRGVRICNCQYNACWLKYKSFNGSVDHAIYAGDQYNIHMFSVIPGA